MAAAASGDKEIVGILAEATRIPAEIIEGARPRWSGYAADGMPNVASVMSQAEFWTANQLVVRMPGQDEIFDLGIAEEARQRLDDKNPFVT
jgi:hypothetical protein